jgi:hypothetical protein
LSKTKWTGQGRKKLRKGYETIWSSKNTGKKKLIEIILIPTYGEKVTDTEFISGRKIKIKLLVKVKEMNFLQIYAPQIGCSIEEKEKFKEIIETKATGKHICIMGDYCSNRKRQKWT